MRRDPFSFPIWWLINAVAIAACVLGAVATAFRPANAASVITGYSCTFAIPIILIVSRKVPLSTVRFVAMIGGLVGEPFAILYGLYVLVVGGVLEGLRAAFIMTVLVGWSSMMVAAFQSSRPDVSGRARPSEILEARGEGH